jgi:hypothetical protein
MGANHLYCLPLGQSAARFAPNDKAAFFKIAHAVLSAIVLSVINLVILLKNL